MRRFTFVGRKGGVGKTSCTVTAADDLAHRWGLKVLVVDMDPQANATRWLGVDEPELTMGDALYHASTDGALEDVVVASEWDRVWCAPAGEHLASREADRVGASDLRLRRLLRTADLSWCDAVIIDSPPSLGPLFLNALNAADHVIVVADSERGGMDGVAGVLDTVAVVSEETHPNLRVGGVIMNKYNASTSEHPARWNEMGRRYGHYARWRFPQRAAVATAYGASRPPREYKSASSFVGGVRDVVDHIMGDS